MRQGRQYQASIHHSSSHHHHSFSHTPANETAGSVETAPVYVNGVKPLAFPPLPSRLVARGKEGYPGERTQKRERTEKKKESKR